MSTPYGPRPSLPRVPVRIGGVSRLDSRARSVSPRIELLRRTYALFFAGIVSAAGGAMAALYAGAPVMLSAGAGRTIAVPPVVAFVLQHGILALVVYLAAFFGMRAVRERPGVNGLALLGFTFVSGLFVAPLLFVTMLRGDAGLAMTAHPVRDAFLLAVGAFGGLTFYAFRSKRDFSFLGGFLTMGLVVLLIATLIGIFVGGSVFHLAIASVGVLLFGGFILYDTSRLLRQDPLPSPIDAAIHLYLDFFNLFLFLVQILGGGRRE